MSSSSIASHPKASFLKGKLVRRNAIQVPAGLSTPLHVKSTFKPQSLLQLHTTCNELSFDPLNSTNISLFPEQDKFGFMHAGIAHVLEDERTVKEVDELMQRVEIVVERMRELEIEKACAKTKGEISIEERQELEVMSREIVNKVLEKPIQYLRYGDGKLEDRLKDLNLLIGMFEQSFLKKENTRHQRCQRNASWVG